MATSEDQTTTGHISREKPLHPRTEDRDDEQDNRVLPRQKRGRKPKSEEVAGSSSCVAIVTAANLQEDTVHLPQDWTRSSRFKRKNSKIVITDGGERSWELNLRFNNSSDTFCMRKGWTHFCVENGKNEGSSFTFELVRTGDIPLLSFCPTETVNDGAQGDQRNHHQRLLDLRFTNDGYKRSRLYLSLKFLRKNGLGEPRIVTLVGKNGMRTLATLLKETSGRMSLGMGWKEFTKANGLVVGDKFTFEVLWKNGVPMLVLFSTESGSQMWQRGGNSSKANETESISTAIINGKETKKDENNIGESSNSASLKDNPVVTLALKPEDVKASGLYIPRKFIRSTGTQKLGKITILGKTQMKCCGYLLAKDGTISVGSDWKDFCEANGVNVGSPFTLEFIDDEEDKTPVYMFSPI